MRRYLLIVFLWAFITGNAIAQEKYAHIEFEETTHDFGKISESDPIRKCVFYFTNTGDLPLIINQAVASCGCTVPSYSKEPIKPGEKGEIKVRYSAKGAFPGHFKKTITIRTNADIEVTRLHIEGEIVEDE